MKNKNNDKLDDFVMKGEVHVDKKWFKAAGIRAIKTMAQTAIATIGTAFVISDVNWLTVASASILAGILSALTSLAGLPELKNESEIESKGE